MVKSAVEGIPSVVKALATGIAKAGHTEKCNPKLYWRKTREGADVWLVISESSAHNYDQELESACIVVAPILAKSKIAHFRVVERGWLKEEGKLVKDGHKLYSIGGEGQ